MIDTDCSLAQKKFTGFSVQLQKAILDEIKRNKNTVLCIGGPTCVGKSEIALELAEKLGGEIVSCDSMQVYRGMNIGTAKPSIEDLLHIPHHLVDIRDLDSPINVVEFHQEILFACQQILERNNLPIVVGGSGFYMHAFIYGPPQSPPPNQAVRDQITQDIETYGLDKAYEKLQILDPEYAQTITHGDRHKIIRALEILQTSGKISTKPWKQARPNPKFDFHCWFFHRPRESLRCRIHRRCEAMIHQGLIEEVKYLKYLGIEQNTSAAHSIGYRQVLHFLQSPQQDSDFHTMLETFKHATCKYAKRQETWFKKEPLFRWIDLDLHDRETVIDILLNDCLA